MTRHDPLKGIALVLAAVVIFAALDSAGKYLMTKHGVPFVAAVRYAVNIAILAALLGPRHGRGLWRTTRTRLVVLRGASLAIATFFMGLALQRMPVGEAVAIVYLQGFGVMIAGGLILKERITGLGWAAAAVGFAGVLFIARPGGALDLFGVLFALIAAAVSVAYILLSRVLASTESTMSLLFHVALAGLVFFAVLLPFHWPSAEITRFDAGLLAILGAGSLGGHYLLTSAYRFAPASTLTPFNYFHIAFAVLFGWLVYGHLPDRWAFAGMAMIALSGAAIALRSHVTGRRQSASLRAEPETAASRE